MTVVVSDDQVAALRAQLAGQGDEHRRLLNQLDPKAANIGYRSQILPLAGLIGDAELTSDELDEFLRRARFFAEELRS